MKKTRKIAIAVVALVIISCLSKHFIVNSFINSISSINCSSSVIDIKKYPEGSKITLDTNEIKTFVISSLQNNIDYKLCVTHPNINEHTHCYSIIISTADKGQLLIYMMDDRFYFSYHQLYLSFKNSELFKILSSV